MKINVIREIADHIASASSVANNILPSVTASAIKTGIEAAVKKSPVVRNELNMEPLTQSRTFIGSLVGFLGSAIIILTAIDQHGLHIDQYNWETFGPAVGAILGVAYAIKGRVQSGLGPIRWFGWFRKKQ